MLENEINVVDTIEEDPTKKYLDQIQEMKKTHVSRDAYDKLRDENKMLLDTIVQGKSFETSSTEEPAKRSITEIANAICAADYKRTEDHKFIGDILELRERVLEEKGIDIGMPTGNKYQFDLNDQAASERVCDALKYCIEASDGNNSIFMREAVRLSGRNPGNNNKFYR